MAVRVSTPGQGAGGRQELRGRLDNRSDLRRSCPHPEEAPSSLLYPHSFPSPLPPQPPHRHSYTSLFPRRSPGCREVPQGTCDKGGRGGCSQPRGGSQASKHASVRISPQGTWPQRPGPVQAPACAPQGFLGEPRWVGKEADMKPGAGAPVLVVALLSRAVGSSCNPTGSLHWFPRETPCSMPELPHLREVKASPTSQLGIQQREGAVPSQSAQPRLTVLHPQTSQDSAAGMVQTQHSGLPEAGALGGCRASTQGQDAEFSTVRELPPIRGRDRDRQADARSAGSRRTLDRRARGG